MFRSYIYALIDHRGNIKIGCTQNPVHRLSVYTTGDAPGTEKEYHAVWEVKASTFRSMLGIERTVHIHFIKDRMKRSDGRSSEWFTTSPAILDAWVNIQTFVIRQMSSDELTDIKHQAADLPKSDATDAIISEDSAISEIDTETKFFATFLRGKFPRRVQEELWRMFEDACDRHPGGLYKAIVQWPTGVGKSIAILIMIVLAAERCSRIGKIYRCLLISPKNDILKTLIPQLEGLRFFGITLLDGSEAKLSSLTIPLNQSVVIVATHNALTDKPTLERLPPIHHVHYDEVHRITGDVFIGNLKEMLVIWETEYLTGTSATPKTSSDSQRQKLVHLFGESISVLHRCGIDEAVKEGWIAPPRYHISVLENNKDHNVVLEAYVHEVVRTMRSKQAAGGLRDGKVIVYIVSSITDVRYAFRYAKSEYLDITFYSAINGERTDTDFVNAPSDGTPRIMFVCQRYREGSDVRGIEMTSMLVGNRTAAYIVLQICGRGMRLDYKEKEAWIHIARPSEDGTTPEDVKNTILLDVLEFIGEKKDGEMIDRAEIEDAVRTYFGILRVNGVLSNIDDTILHVQDLYIRREVGKRTCREKYNVIRNINRELGLRCKMDYLDSKDHPSFVPDPKKYFEGSWTSWCDFLGINTSSFPPTKSEFHLACKQGGIRAWDDYRQKWGLVLLPENPDEFYADWTSTSEEFPVEEELIW